MQWDSPWGKGYPGWHIECSAMSSKHLGKTLDIHTGGEDNIFPHHESEIAQSEGANGVPFVKYWMHTSHLLVEGEKMSKRLGNFYTLRDLLKKGYDPLAIRYLLLSAHYKTKLNFTEKGLESSEKTLDRIRFFVRSMANHRPGKAKPGKVDPILREARIGFEISMDDDLGISDALSSIFQMMGRVNKERDSGRLSREDASKVYGFMLDLDRVLGLNLDRIPFSVKIPAEVQLLVKEREAFRKSRDFRKADKLRVAIRKEGFIVEDTPEGPKVRKAQEGS
jgi:cysteinyl-tRNA synthetase